MREIYLHSAFCAVAEDGRLVEYIPLRAEDQTGQILWGKVNRMMPALEAAFVDIGRKRDGFLPLRENSRSFTEGPLRSGEKVLVQIRKEEIGEKGAYLSRDLSLAGSYLILMPRNRHIGVSARIEDPEARAKLLALGQELAGQRFGLVMREAAVHQELDALHRELETLLLQWQEIQAGEITPLTVADELLRDYRPRGIARIRQEEALPPDLVRQRKESENRRVQLPHGGNIVIDRCEAMTVIDVNSASDAGAGDHRATTLRTNLEACQEIMIQTRVRNLSGVLIIDFIDMGEETDRVLVQQTLKDAFGQDRVKTVIHGYTSLGLMEMTRKRARTI
ncbi:MAG: ribonuclease E/G [Clostridia bacterium]|nr:ribonuclease E/G [Clostridia bacterium]